MDGKIETNPRDDPGQGDLSRSTRILDRVRVATRRLHYSIRTEDAYVQWARRFILFQGKRHPDEMGEAEIVGFLNHLAVEGRVAASTRNQALSALLFLYKVVLGRELEWFSGDLTPAKRPERLPVVLTREEVRAVLGHLSGHHRLAGLLMYGAGLRLMEAVRLRVKDVDFGQNHLLIREAKGDKDRVTVLPATLIDALRAQIRDVRAQHERDEAEGFGRVYLPHALAKKFPNADRELGWQYLFPASRRAVDPRLKDGVMRRHHLAESAVQKMVKGAVRRSGLRSRQAATPCGTASPLTSWRTARTSAPCRNCWGMPTCAPP